MKFVIDSNILISALIRDSTTRRIIMTSNEEFYYPEISFHEIRKYKELILKKSGMDENEYASVLQLLVKHITLVPEEQFIGKLAEANKTLGQIDPDDIVFLATALSINDAKIWSNDPHLHRQDKIKALRTEELMRLFE
ncbi:MAG: PIN domain-containing protein [Nanoarchaeota archaeon]